MRVPTFLVAAALVLAGCIGAPDATDPDGADVPDASDLPTFPNMMVQDHDHTDPTEHEQGVGLEVVHWDPIDGSATSASGAHVVDARGDRLFVGMYGTETRPYGGVVVYDISDPRAPTELGSWNAPGPLGGDRSVEATPDGNYILVGQETVTCFGHVNPTGGGLLLLDATDPTLITEAFRVPAQGVHSVTTAEIDGDTYVFTILSPANLDNVYRIDETPAGPILTAVSSIPLSHDTVVVEEDPYDGRAYLYAADGSREMNIWDVTDPTNPQLVTTWDPRDTEPEDAQERYYIHTTAVFHQDDRRIVVVSSEDWLEYASPFWVVDVTDLNAPEPLGRWENPWSVPSEGLRFSMHNPRADEANDRLVFSHYHGGVQVFPFGDEAHWTQPQARAWALPHEDTGYRADPVDVANVVRGQLCGEFNLAASPLTMDVEVVGDLIYAADVATGLYVYEEVPVDAPSGDGTVDDEDA